MISKKKISGAVIACAMSLLAAHAAHAQETCQDRAQAIKNKIAIAEQHQNKWEVAGLKTALNKLTTHCTDKSLTTELMRKRDKLQAKLAKKQADIKEAEDKVSRAKALADKPERLAKAQKKLANKQRDLVEIEKEIQEIQHALGK